MFTHRCIIRLWTVATARIPSIFHKKKKLCKVVSCREFYLGIFEYSNIVCLHILYCLYIFYVSNTILWSRCDSIWNATNFCWRISKQMVKVIFFIFNIKKMINSNSTLTFILFYQTRTFLHTEPGLQTQVTIIDAWSECFSGFFGVFLHYVRPIFRAKVDSVNYSKESTQRWP